MRLHTLVPILVALLHCSHAAGPEDNTPGKKYYVDRTCTDRGDVWTQRIQQAFDMAKGALDRLNSDQDTDFATIYEQIMKSKKQDDQARLTYVKGVLAGIKNWNKIDTIEEAEVRFMCDDDKENKENTIAEIFAEGNDRTKYPTRFRPTASGGWFDYKNAMFLNDNGRLCQGMAEGNARGVTVCTLHNRYLEGDVKAYDLFTNWSLNSQYSGALWEDFGPQNSNYGNIAGRQVIVICDYAFEEPPDDVFGNLFPPLPRHTDDELKAQNWDRSLIEGFRLLTSVTMLHEMVHAQTRAEVGDKPDLDHAYGWENILRQTPENAFKNADNYAYLGLFSMLSEWGYTLPRLDEPNTKKEDQEKDIQEGILRAYNDITKRLVRMVRRYFRA